MTNLLSSFVGFFKTHGVEIVTTYVATVSTLVASHTTPLTGGAMLALFGTAALMTAKQFGGPVLTFAQGLLAKVGLGSKAAGK